MSHDLDTRARRAAVDLKAAVEKAELRSALPGATTDRRRLVGFLRPAWVAVFMLMLVTALGLAVVMDSTPAPTTLVPPTSTIVTSSTVGSTVTTEPTPPTSVAVVPIAPTTTVAPDLEPPPLEITSPEDGAELDEKTVTFAGTTEPGARVFAGEYEAEVDSSGEWHIVLILNEGSNVVRFVARDAAGNESEASVTVYYVPPSTTTTTTESEIAEFTAYATFGSCSETPPFDIYYGTGEPGSTVEVTSDYGSGSVKVDEEGNWELKVIFESAPPDEPFIVTVSDEYGRQAEFEFVYTP